MRLHFLTVPVHGSSTEAEDELNHFLSTRRIVAVDRQLVPDGARSAWAVCIAYVDSVAAATDPNGKKRVDYREALPEAEFQVFAKLRDLRKQIAERDAVPPYAVFTNEQLAEMVRRSVRTAAELGRIDGVGPARVEKYAERFLAILCAASATPATRSSDASS